MPSTIRPPYPNWCYYVAKAAVDLTVLAIAYTLAFLARFEGALPDTMVPIFWVSLPVVLAIRFATLQAAGVSRLAWRAVSLTEVLWILRALVLASGILILVRFAALQFAPSVPVFRYLVIPLGVLLIDFPLAAFATIGVRVLWRRRTERRRKLHLLPTAPESMRTVILGTGPSAIQAARDLAFRHQAGIDLVGIISESGAKIGMMMYGLPVLGSLDGLGDVAMTHGLEQVLIPLPDDGTQVRKLVNHCETCGLRTRVLAEADTDNEKLDLARLRQVTVEDLLRRPPVRLEGNAVATWLRDRRVVVTGAGGSIGSQLCREICRFGPAQLLLIEQAENNLFNIHRQLARECPHADLVPLVADICDIARLEGLFSRYQPQVVFHAAAHKHVPMMECNVREAIKNNVEGTMGLADVAERFGVGHFVMVSTDKAVRPTSVMGVSKRAAELYVQALADHARTHFVTVRFGNVLGSSGSVIPIFQEQIARGGPVTVTHPDMQRYFMTIPEACQLILEAGALGEGGEIFVLDMGQPVKIVDLAHDMIRLCGLVPGQDIEVRFTGIRPGEKLYEELNLEGENAGRTRHPRIFIGRKQEHELSRLREQIHELIDLADCGDPERMRRKFREIVPEYQCPTKDTPSDLDNAATCPQMTAVSS
jgi:FlaA1/EpsC-like NDP-sugar epimerase